MMSRKAYKQFAEVIKDNTKSINIDVSISDDEDTDLDASS